MKRMKRVVAMIFTLCILFTMFPAVTLAASTTSGTCGGDLTWTLDSAGTLTITGTGAMKNWCYGESPWYNNSLIKSVIIEDGATSIGQCSFVNCTNLQSVTIPDSITRIEIAAFECCSSLQSISIPDSVTSIAGDAFYNCSDLIYICVDENNPYYSSDSFGVLFNKDKTTLIQAPNALSGSYIIPDSVIHIGDSAFRYCTSLTSVIIGKNVVNIGNYAFADCESLIGLTIPDGVSSIGEYGFHFCISLTNIIIPGSITRIGDFAFYYSYNLRDVIVEKGVEQIGESAFDTCSSLTHISIPSSVMSIGKSAFSWCNELTDVYYTGGESQWKGITIGGNNSCLTGAIIHYNHTHDYSLFPVITVEPTCTEAGHIEYTCIYGDTYREPIAALGHGLRDIQETHEATCTSGGYTVTKCVRCEELFQIEQIDALGHDFSGAVTVVIPTCTAQGFTQTQCIRCEEVVISDYVNSTGHEMVVVPAKEATCTEDGRTIGSCCEKCGMVGVASEMIPAIGHNYTDSICANCGENIPFALTDKEGNLIGNFTTLTAALTAATKGQTLSLQADVVEEKVVLSSGVNLDLNGYTLTVDSVLSYSSSAIMDSSEDVSGLLKINDAGGNMISADNSQLPVYDNAAGGYRFFAIDVEPSAVTGKNSGTPKYWFKVKAEKFAPLYELIQADSEVQIKVKMTWDGQSEYTYAAADLAFTKAWADRYNANEDIYITVTVNEAKGVENFKLIPMITSGGVEISGEEMQ